MLLLRTPPIGMPSALARYISQMFDFSKGSILPLVGAAPTYTRATIGTVEDFEGSVKNVLSGEARFGGMRRAHNLLARSNTPSEVFSGANWTKASCTVAHGVSDPSGGTTAATMTATAGNADLYSVFTATSGESIRNSGWIRRRTGTGTVQFVTVTGSRTTVSISSAWQRYADVVTTAAGNSTIGWRLVTSGDEIDIWHPMPELVGNQSVQSPSEYVSVGVLSSPFHGCGVDGVRYLSTENGNTVASNVVTEATGPSLEGYAVGQLPGASGAYFSTPDSAANSVTGDIDIRVKATADDWTPATAKMFAAKYTAGQISWYLQLGTTGTLGFQYTSDGSTTAGRLATSSAANTFPDGTQRWVRVTYATATGKVNFYHSEDGATWTALGVEQTITSGSVFDGTAAVEVGSFNGGSQGWAGRIHRAQVYNGIGGTLVADFNPRDYSSGTTFASATTGETWTVNGAASIYKNTIRGLQVEEARTNLVLQSSNFGTTWAVVTTPTRSAAAAYCGDIALDLIGDDSAAELDGYQQAITFTGDAVKSVSFIVKQGSSTSTAVRLRDTTAPADRILGVITWSSGVPTYTPTTGTQERAPQALGNGCYRIFAASSSVTAANTNVLIFYPATDSALTNTGTGTIYVGGVQAENGTFATSHVPTTTGTVPRNADVFSATLGSWFNAVQGSFVAAFRRDTLANSGNGRVVSFTDGTANEKHEVVTTAGTTGISFLNTDNTTTQWNIVPTPITIGALNKISCAYAAADGAASTNGTTIAAASSGTLPTVTTLELGITNGGTAGNVNGFIKSFAYYPVRLPNAVLQALST